MKDDFLNTDKMLDILFAENPGDLLINVKNHLEKENLKPVSMNIIKEHNNFCALVIGKPKEKFIG